MLKNISIAKKLPMLFTAVTTVSVAIVGVMSYVQMSNTIENDAIAKVIAVEPNPKTLARLRFNVAINDFAEKVTVVPFGIGEEGEFELISSGDLGSASIRPNQTKNDRTIVTKIRTRPLLNILNEAGVQSIEGLKIDIEGMEDRALIPFFNDAPKSLWPKCVVIEDCTSDHWESDVIAYMQSIGYTLSSKTRANTILELAISG